MERGKADFAEGSLDKEAELNINSRDNITMNTIF